MLHDGKQIVIPLSLHHSPGSISDFLEHEGDKGQGNNTFKEEKSIVSWADECDTISIVSCSECELWGTEENIIRGVAMEEPLFVQPLAVANPDVHLEVKGASTNLSPWVLSHIKAFRKSVGTSLEGFKAEITGLFLALEAKKKSVVQGKSSRKKGNKLGVKGSRELKSLLSSWNFEKDSTISSSVVRDRDLAVPQ